MWSSINDVTKVFLWAHKPWFQVKRDDWLKMTCWTWHVGQKDLVYISRLLASSYTTRQQHVRTTPWSSRTLLLRSWASSCFRASCIKESLSLGLQLLLLLLRLTTMWLVRWLSDVYLSTTCFTLHGTRISFFQDRSNPFLTSWRSKMRNAQVSLLAVFPSVSLLADTIAPQSSGDQCNNKKTKQYFYVWMRYCHLILQF